MWSIVIRIVIGILLMVHGFAHWQITTDRRRVVAAGSRTCLRTNLVEGAPRILRGAPLRLALGCA
jgi:hypothetical protein